MYNSLIDRSSDLKRLRDEGYNITVSGAYVFIHDIPYVNNRKEIMKGVLVSTLNLCNGFSTSIPDTHVIDFIGDHPCNKDGSLIKAIQHSTLDRIIMEGVVINHSFSNKPAEGYLDYYQKVKRYADIISAPAKSLDRNITEKTFKVIPSDEHDSIFRYVDTHSSRANISQLNMKFVGQRIAIVGLGGTGSYVLDLVSKVPVKEIHLFDGDNFQPHNAFRSPGAASISSLENQISKVEYYSSIYSEMHTGIIPHKEYLSKDNISLLDNMTYVFICIDKGPIKKELLKFLIDSNTVFIDVGMGVSVVDNYLTAMLRVTTGTSEKNDHLSQRISTSDNEDNEYASNIQIADLNSLNASLAVIKWKKLSGFYLDLSNEHNSCYATSVTQFANDDFAA